MPQTVEVVFGASEKPTTFFNNDEEISVNTAFCMYKNKARFVVGGKPLRFPPSVRFGATTIGDIPEDLRPMIKQFRGPQVIRTAERDTITEKLILLGKYADAVGRPSLVIDGPDMSTWVWHWKGEKIIEKTLGPDGETLSLFKNGTVGMRRTRTVIVDWTTGDYANGDDYTYEFFDATGKLHRGGDPQKWASLSEGYDMESTYDHEYRTQVHDVGYYRHGELSRPRAQGPASVTREFNTAGGLQVFADSQGTETHEFTHNEPETPEEVAFDYQFLVPNDWDDVFMKSVPRSIAESYKHHEHTVPRVKDIRS